MKHLLLLLLALIHIPGSATAQINNSGQPDCRIWYDYDAAGQRVKRYYRCTNPDGVADNLGGTIRVTIFPNPTDGPVIVVTDVDVEELSAAIYGINGAYIMGNSCNDCTDVSLSLEGYPPGSYAVQVTAVKAGYEQLSEGYTVILQSE